MDALPRGIRRNAVNSHGRENQRHQSERAHKCSGDALLEAGDLPARFQIGHIKHHQGGIQFVNGFLDRRAAEASGSPSTRALTIMVA